MLNEKKRTWAEVKATSLQYNYYKIREYIPEGCKIMGVVKANAYGHGAVTVSKIMERFGCDYLGVATIDEAEELRSAGVKLPILILSHTSDEFLDRVIKADCAQALGSPEAARLYSKRLQKSSQKLKVHIKLETGMGRTGFDAKSGGYKGVLDALAMDCFEAEGVFTHFASADDLEQRDYTLGQFELFNKAVVEIEENSGKKFALKHCANSAAMISYPQTHLDMVRVGISLYGVYPGPDRGTLDLSPAMELHSRIIQIAELEPGDSVSYGRHFTADKKMRVAVLPVGYADGLHRGLSGKIDVIINGTRCRQLGTICMDMCLVDVTELSKPAIGDMAVIFGHDKHEVITVTELADKIDTISYELLCAVSARVPRVYAN